MFELDGDRVAAPTGTLIFAPSGVKRTAFAEEPETTVIALGGTPGKAYEPTAGRSGLRSLCSMRQASSPRRPIADANWSRLIPSTPGSSRADRAQGIGPSAPGAG
jgi:hypothetical protein